MAAEARNERELSLPSERTVVCATRKWHDDRQRAGGGAGQRRGELVERLDGHGEGGGGVVRVPPSPHDQDLHHAWPSWGLRKAANPGGAKKTHEAPAHGR